MRRALKLAFPPILFFAAVCMYALCYYYGFTINSDNAFFVRAGEQMIFDNPMLKNWYACDPTARTTDFLWTGLLRLVFSRKVTMYWMGALVYALIVVFSFLLMKEKFRDQFKLPLLLFIALITFPPEVARYPMLSVGVHSISILYTIILFCIFDKINLGKRSVAWFIFYTIFLIFSSLNDEWPVYFFALPALAVLAIDIFISPRKHEIILFFCTLIGVAGEKLVRYVYESSGGIRTLPYQTNFIDLDQIVDFLVSTLKTTLSLFNADFSDYQIFSLETVYALSGIALLGLIFFSFFDVLRHWNQSDTTDKTLICGALFCVGSFALARVYKDPQRNMVIYLTPFFFMSILALARWESKLAIPVRRFELVFFLPILIQIVCNLPRDIYRKPIIDRQFEAISDFLLEQGRTRVYTTFWDSHALWYYSDGQIETAAVEADHDRLEPFIWLTNMTWYDPMYYVDTFVLSPNNQYVTDEMVRKVFGEPQRTHEIDQTVIYFYEENISPQIAR